MKTPTTFRVFVDTQYGSVEDSFGTARYNDEGQIIIDMDAGYELHLRRGDKHVCPVRDGVAMFELAGTV